MGCCGGRLYRMLSIRHEFHTDEKQLIQNAQQAAEELASLFEAERG